MRTLRTTSPRRGSALVLVVAVLTVLLILTFSMQYSTRMDLLEARNWANKVQAQMAATTAVPLFTPSLSDPRYGTSTPLRPAGNAAAAQEEELEPFALRLQIEEPPTTIGALDADDDAPAARFPTTLMGYGSAAISLSQLSIVNTSGQININAVIPATTGDGPRRAAQRDADAGDLPPGFMTEQLLARFIRSTLDARGVYGVNAEEVAHAIAMRRYGADGAPGLAGRDDNANSERAMPDRDALDNDADRIVDEPGEMNTGTAADGLDNDRDGEYDEPGETIAADGLDNDLDGVVDEADESIDDPDESLADPRLPARGDDRPFARLSELLTIPGMTAEAYEALYPFLTTFSVSYGAFDLTASGRAEDAELGWPQVDPNSAPPERIALALERRLPGKSPEMLAQFAVNIVDRRDEDSVPTVIALGGRKYIGQEIVPFINEVCPDTMSDELDNDNGEYLELFNPWSQALDISGWSVRGGGVTIGLRGMLPAGGFIAITDDYYNEDEPIEAASYSGSFLGLFGAPRAGAGKQVMVVPELSLPNDAGELTLHNREGKLIDRFAWTEGRWDGRNYSFQRADPRVATARRLEATPLRENLEFALNPAQRREAFDLQEKWHDQPFGNALDVMLVSGAFAGDTGGQWGLPTLDGATTTQPDVRMVDCFRVGAVLPPSSSERERDALLIDRRLTLNELRDAQRPRLPEHTEYLNDLRPRCEVVHGRLNVNTAPAATLGALPGMERPLLQKIVEARLGLTLKEQIRRENSRQKLGPTSHEWWSAPGALQAPRWRNLSDLLLDEAVWEQASLFERLDQVYPFYRLLTTHSMSVAVLSSSRGMRDPANGRRRAAAVSARRVLAADRGVVETVSFELLRGGSPWGDADLRYAAPASKVRQLDLTARFPDVEPGLLLGRVVSESAAQQNPPMTRRYRPPAPIFEDRNGP